MTSARRDTSRAGLALPQRMHLWQAQHQLAMLFVCRVADHQRLGRRVDVPQAPLQDVRGIDGRAPGVVVRLRDDVHTAMAVAYAPELRKAVWSWRSGVAPATTVSHARSFSSMTSARAALSFRSHSPTAF